MSTYGTNKNIRSWTCQLHLCFCTGIKTCFLTQRAAGINPLTPNDPYRGSTAPLTSKVAVKWNTRLMQHCAGFISAESLYIRRRDDLPATITHVPVAAVLALNTPDDGRLRPKHVEWLCRNKTCTVLHQVGVSFHLYYDARKHKIKIKTLKLHFIYLFNKYRY